MDDATFAHQLSAWLDPFQLLSSADRYEHEREQALSPSALVIGSTQLQNGDEGNFAALAAQLTRGFSVPAGVLRLLEHNEDHSGFSAETLEWLLNLRLSANVRVCRRDDPPEGVPPNTILIIEERDAVVDLLHGPVLALLDLVGVMAENWRRVASLGISVFHEPMMPTPFYAYVDREVARSYLTLMPPPHVTGTVLAKSRYRAVTVCGRAAHDDPIWQVERSVAREAAFSTLKPITD